MTLSQKIVDAVDASRVTGWVSVEGGGRRLSLDLTACGPVGLACNALKFAAVDPEVWSPEALRSWADTLSARVNYLMEPLTVLEHDRLGGVLILRSQAPTPRNDQNAYYEARLEQDGALTLTRLAFDNTARRRRPVPCQLTREVLERLADDLVASVR